MATAITRIEDSIMPMKTYSRLFAALFFLSMLAVAQERQAPMSMTTASIPGGSGFGSGATVPIGSGDLLEMSVFDTPELSGKLRVSNLGDISLPLVGSVHVDGMKAVEAQTLIRQKYIDGGFLKDPQVTLFIAEYATQGVSVVGEVKSPGIYPAFGSHHLLDYLSVAQGLTPLAGTTIVITHAGHPDQPQSVKMTAGAAPLPLNNPEILPGDTIYVQRTGLIYVVGDVVRPGGFPMDHDGQLTILQAVALAMGTSPTAAKSSAKLIRTTPQGREEIPVNLKKILSAKSIDLPMQDNDIFFVPSSVAKSALRDFETAIPAAASATIYHIP
jgi:polysaccharide export outer membrane protein